MSLENSVVAVTARQARAIGLTVSKQTTSFESLAFVLLIELLAGCSDDAREQRPRSRSCIEDDIPRMEAVALSAVNEVNAAWTLEKNKPFLDEIVSQSGVLEVVLDEPGSLDTLTYRIFSSCDLDFQFEIAVRTIGDSEVTSVRVSAINAPTWYDVTTLRSLNRDF